jgi:hypothetical protein
MPLQLVNLLSKEENFDLLAWLENGAHGAGQEHHS